MRQLAGALELQLVHGRRARRGARRGGRRQQRRRARGRGPRQAEGAQLLVLEAVVQARQLVAARVQQVERARLRRRAGDHEPARLARRQLVRLGRARRARRAGRDVLRY